MITYKQIKDEVESISLEIASSEQVVPSYWALIKPFKIVYCLVAFFVVACFVVSDDIYFANVAFSGVVVFVFLIISAFLSSYTGMFMMLPGGSWKKYKILRILRKKIKVYGGVYTAVIFTSGTLALFCNGAVGIIPISAFVAFVVLFISFNIDVSRYQLSSLFGVLAAAKSGLTK